MTKSLIMDFYNLFLCSGVQPLMLKWRPDLISTRNSALETEVCGNFLNERDALMYGTLLPPGQDVFVLLMASAYLLQFCLSCNFGIFSPRLPWLEMRRRANAA